MTINRRRIKMLFLCTLQAAFILAQNENVMNGPKPLPGGKISFSNNYYVELVFGVNDTSHVYLFDSESKPFSNIAISGKIVFQNYDSTISTFDLTPFKDSQFIVKTHFPKYKRCDVYFEIYGAGILARFIQLEEITTKTN